MAGLIGIDAAQMDIVDALQRGKWEWQGEWKPRPVVRLTNRVPVGFRRDGRWVIQDARWGVPVGPSRPVGNARDDRLTSSRLWSGLLEEGRCLVPATAVFELIKEPVRQSYAFRRVDRAPIVMPGLVAERNVKGEKRLCAAIVTTQPNEFFDRFHDRQVCSLDGDDAAAWVTGDAEEALALLRPPSRDAWEAVPVFDRVFAHDRRDAEGVEETGPPLRWGDAALPPARR